MATISSRADGDWNTASTWDTGTVPTISDTVFILHSITFAADISADWLLLFPTGSLVVDTHAAVYSQITAHVHAWTIHMQPGYSDTRTFNIDGVLLDGCVPRIACVTYGNLTTVGDWIPQDDARNVIIDDPGYYGTSAVLQDVKPEGAARAYTRKVSNGVRYLTVTVRIRSSATFLLGRLYRMAASPYQVMLSTNRCVIKGYIESIVPDQAAVGTEYISVKVTVAEGR